MVTPIPGDRLDGPVPQLLAQPIMSLSPAELLKGRCQPETGEGSSRKWKEPRAQVSAWQRERGRYFCEPQEAICSVTVAGTGKTKAQVEADLEGSSRHFCTACSGLTKPWLPRQWLPQPPRPQAWGWGPGRVLTDAPSLPALRTLSWPRT